MSNLKLIVTSLLLLRRLSSFFFSDSSRAIQRPKSFLFFFYMTICHTTRAFYLVESYVNQVLIQMLLKSLIKRLHINQICLTLRNQWGLAAWSAESIYKCTLHDNRCHRAMEQNAGFCITRPSFYVCFCERPNKRTDQKKIFFHEKKWLHVDLSSLYVMSCTELHLICLFVCDSKNPLFFFFFSCFETFKCDEL